MSLIHLLFENQFNLLKKSTYLGMFNHSETPVGDVFLYIQNYVLSLKNSQIEILFCQSLRPRCTQCTVSKYIEMIMKWLWNNIKMNRKGKEKTKCVYETNHSRCTFLQIIARTLKWSQSWQKPDKFDINWKSSNASLHLLPQ